MERKVCIVFPAEMVEWLENKRAETRETFATVVRQAIYQAMTGKKVELADIPATLKRGPGRPPKEKAPPPEPKMWTVDNPPDTVEDIISWMLDHMIAAKRRGEIVSLYRIPERDKELWLLLMARNKNYRHTTPAGLTDGTYAFMASGKVKDTGEKEGDAPILEIVGEPIQVNPVPEETFTPYLIAPPAKPTPVAPVKQGW